jgi:hypothetical protein
VEELLCLSTSHTWELSSLVSPNDFVKLQEQFFVKITEEMVFEH